MPILRPSRCTKTGLRALRLNVPVEIRYRVAATDQHSTRGLGRPGPVPGSSDAFLGLSLVDFQAGAPTRAALQSGIMYELKLTEQVPLHRAVWDARFPMCERILSH